MKRTIALLFCLLMITMPMAGCLGGDDSPDAQDEELDDWNVHFAATAADLPTCDEDTNGRLYYVEADNQFQVCKTSGWSVIDIQGADGQDGADGAQGPAGADGQDGMNGADGQDGADGAQGPAGADGQDGAQGPQGPQGPAGSNGADGQDGEDGTSILITTSSSTSCANGGNTFNIGPDSNSNGFLEAAEVVMNVDVCNGAQGPQGPQGPAGNDGADGQDGQDGAQGPQGPQGPAGNDGADGQDGAQGPQGPQGPTGNDGADGQDGADGAQGPQGPQGPAGNDGADGQDGDEGPMGPVGPQGPQGPAGNDGSTALIATSTEPVGTNCANGGVKIEAGVDDNGNGQLDFNEVDSTQYICDGASSASTILTSVSPPPTSMGCDAGGSVIANGLDNGDGSGIAANGQLEPGEVDFSTTFCSKLVTTMVKDIDTSSTSNGPAYLTAVGNTVFFRGYDSTNGYALWKSDETTAGTVMVKDTYTGSSTSTFFGPASLKAVGNTLFFSGYDTTNGSALWKSDGTTAGTVMVKDTDPSGTSNGPYSLTAIGNTLFFRGYDTTNGWALWKSDGTTAGTVMVKDTYTGSGTSSNYGPNYLTAVGNTLFFRGYDTTNGYALWKSDGTTAGTVMVKDTYTGSSTSSVYGPTYITAIGNTLFFRGYDLWNGYALWKSDGTTSGTVMVKDTYTGSSGTSAYGPELLTAVENTLFFRGYDSTNGYTLWKSDGTTAGTVMVKDTDPSGTSNGPSSLTAVGNTLFFSGYDTINGGALWKSDGTTAGTVMVKDTYPSSTCCGPSELTAVGNTLFFRSYDTTNGGALWKSDGTTAGTVIVKDTDPSTLANGPSSLTAVGNTLFFSGYDTTNGYALWRCMTQYANLDMEVINEITYS